MTKFAIKTVDGRYLKLSPEEVAHNAEHMLKHGTLRIGPCLSKKPYNYKTQAQADYVQDMIASYVQQNNSTADERAAVPSEWRYHNYIDSITGAVVEQL